MHGRVGEVKVFVAANQLGAGRGGASREKAGSGLHCCTFCTSAASAATSPERMMMIFYMYKWRTSATVAKDCTVLRLPLCMGYS